MSWDERYLPPNDNIWKSQSDIPAEGYFYQYLQPINLLTEKIPDNLEGLTFGLLGFKCDEGIQRDLKRVGAFEGPVAIRQKLGKLPIQNPNIYCFDVGNIVCTDYDLEATQISLASLITLLLKNKLCPLVLGGGHELAIGQYEGIVQAHPNKRLGILNFDAHFDLHPLQPSYRGSSSTVFYQIAKSALANQGHFDYNCLGIQHAGNTRQAFDIAKQFNTKIILADDLHQGLQEKCFDFIDRIIDENDLIYVSLSLDVFSPAFAPGVSTIQPLGLSPWQIIPLLRQVSASGKVVSYDIVEHVPRYDIDHRTAKLAATLIYEIIHHHHAGFKK
jgi:formiminoglutamase